MKTVHEVAGLFGVSVRTIQYYDRQGLLPASDRTQAGYRLYDEAALERLSQIMMFRELEFPLKDIRRILEDPDFDRERALRQQIELLTLRKEHLEGLIGLAREALQKGEDETMDYGRFSREKIEEYTRRAREEWGGTREYRDYEKRAEGRSEEESRDLQEQFMELFGRLGRVKERPVEDPEVQELVGSVHRFICDHFYDCSLEVFASLGKAYGAGGEFTENIDKAGGKGTGAFAARAVDHYCRGKKG